MKQVKKNISHEDCKKNEAEEGQKGKEKLETFLLNNDIVFYVENPKELKKTTLWINKEFSKVIGKKADMKISAIRCSNMLLAQQ